MISKDLSIQGSGFQFGVWGCRLRINSALTRRGPPRTGATTHTFAGFIELRICFGEA